MLSRAGTSSRPERVVIEFGASHTGDGAWAVQLEIGCGSGQNTGLGKENRGELVGRVWLETGASEHDRGGQTLAETPLDTGGDNLRISVS